ncbi:MAG: hypothetical protein WC119_01935 [Synergistaceae bacterium]
MKIYRISQKMQQFIRGENAETLTKATGEAGTGYYFSPINNSGMSEYYTNDAKHVWIATSLPSCNIVDLTSSEHINGIIRTIRENADRMKESFEHYIVPKVNKSNYQRFPYSVEEYVRLLGDVDAYLINHEHSEANLPSGKQLVIINLSEFDLNQVR